MRLSATLCADCELSVLFWQAFVCVEGIVVVTADSIDFDIVLNLTPLASRED